MSHISFLSSKVFQNIFRVSLPIFVFLISNSLLEAASESGKAVQPAIQTAESLLEDSMPSIPETVTAQAPARVNDLVAVSSSLLPMNKKNFIAAGDEADQVMQMRDEEIQKSLAALKALDDTPVSEETAQESMATSDSETPIDSAAAPSLMEDAAEETLLPPFSLESSPVDQAARDALADAVLVQEEPLNPAPELTEKLKVDMRDEMPFGAPRPDSLTPDPESLMNEIHKSVMEDQKLEQEIEALKNLS